MTGGSQRVLAINPGSTSTKLGIFDGPKTVAVTELRHADHDLAAFAGKPILNQREFRRAALFDWLANTEAEQLDAVVGRGGLLRPLQSGTYLVNDDMLAELRRHERGEHASNLGAVLANEISTINSIPAYIVDPVSVDEWPEHVRLSGHPLLERQCLSHALNTKAVAKRYAADVGRAYSDLRLIVAHLGSGISVSAHESGLMIDVTNSREEGAFSTERAGGVPVMQLVDLCFSGDYTRDEVETELFRKGGLTAYLGTRNLLQVERSVAEGDRHATVVMRAMTHQIAREIGAMAATLGGRVDAILLTGGMARSKYLVSTISRDTRWIAEISVHPGEDELRALADGALRALSGDEVALPYTSA